MKLSGDWKDYSNEEDKILKRAFMAGFPQAKFHLRGQDYVYDFKSMTQKNAGSGKERSIRAPFKWKQPSKPIVPAGPTTVINVPPGSPGTAIQVPYPGKPGAFITVNVPASAKPGQAMLVPIPKEAMVTSGGTAHPDAPKPGKDSAWTTGGVAAVAGGAAVAGAGMAVGGAVLGMAVAEHGHEAVGDAALDGLTDAADVVGDAAIDAGEFVVDAADEIGDFFMDLF